MKVLYLINYAGQGGSEKYVEDLAKNLIKKGDTPFLVYNKKGVLVERLSKIGVKCLFLKMSSPYDIGAAIKLAVLCKKLGIDIIHTQFARENYIAIFAKLFGGPNIVYTSHINLANTLAWKLSNFFLTRANSAVIAVCTPAKELLIKNKYPKNKIHIIFNGVAPITEQRDIPKKEPFVFVTLARLSYEKGLMFLLEGVAELVAQNKELDFIVKIAGSGPIVDELMGYIRLYNLQKRVQMLGYIEDPSELLENSHVYINSSQSEALSFAILEAMAVGLPVIATNVGGNVDIIQKSHCGILVEYGNNKQLASAMQTMIKNTNQYNQYSKNAQTAIKETFNIAKTYQKTYDLYKKTIGG